jgi:Spy/CpxP family protein refolding chaperone
MFGILFGGACLVAAGVVLARGRRHRHHGWHRHHHRHGGFRRRVLYRLFESLDATPAQERELRALAEDTVERLGALRPRAGEMRTAVAEAFGPDAIDEARLTDVETRVTDTAREATHLLRETLAKVHALLDEGQRQRLARFLSRGPSWA